MGRKRSRNNNLPPGMRARHRDSKIYYFLDTGGKPRHEIALGTDYVQALIKLAELTQDDQTCYKENITFRYVAERYQLDEAFTKRAPRTQKDYSNYLTKLYEFFDNPPAILELITTKHISAYLEWRVKDTIERLGAKGKPVKGNEGQVCANREKAVFSCVWNFARRKGFTNAANPCAGAKNFKETGRDIYIDDATYQAVLAQADQPTQFTIQLAYLTGQRPADVLKLARTDICEGAIKVQQNKTNKRLRIAIEGELEQLINRIIQVTPESDKVHSLALICSESGEALTASAFRGRFDKARKAAAKIEDERGQHEFAADIRAFQFRDLRAKAGTDKEEYAGMAATRDQLGHADEKMTRKYVRHRKGKLVSPTK